MLNIGHSVAILAHFSKEWCSVCLHNEIIAQIFKIGSVFNLKISQGNG
jgi:hypothetical protein